MRYANRALTLKKWRPRMIALAHTVKKWSSCVDGKQHGCVLAVDGKYIVSTGFNGVHRLKVIPHCMRVTCTYEQFGKVEDGCELFPVDCDAVHAEINAIINAARVGASISKCWAYLTKQPCEPCRSALINAGIQVIVWDEEYRHAEKPESNGVETF